MKGEKKAEEFLWSIPENSHSWWHSSSRSLANYSLSAGYDYWRWVYIYTKRSLSKIKLHWLYTAFFSNIKNAFAIKDHAQWQKKLPSKRVRMNRTAKLKWSIEYFPVTF